MGDRDWLAVTLEAGTRYRIELEGSPTSQGTLADSYLRGVYDAGGNLIPDTHDDESGIGRNSEEVFLVDGRIPAAADGFDCHTSATLVPRVANSVVGEGAVAAFPVGETSQLEVFRVGEVAIVVV